MRAPSQEPNPGRFHVAIAVVAVFLTMMIGVVSSQMCGTARPSSPHTTSPLCVSIWNFQQLAQPPMQPVAIEPSAGVDLHIFNARKGEPVKREEQEKPRARKKGNLLSKLIPWRRFKQKGKSGISQYPKAFSPLDLNLSRNEDALVKELSRRVRDAVPHLERRATTVPWGGPGGSSWWRGDGTHLLHAYLKIMKWPQDLTTNFPFGLCSSTGCNAEVSVRHTLEWREKYKPWCISPSAIQENAQGFVYARGYSPSLTVNSAGHSIVWLRLSASRVKDPVQWVRAIMNSLERAVADSLYRTGGKVGRFNCIVDGQGFNLGMLMGMGAIKRMVVMLQDHFPDRMGVLLMTNFSKPAQMFLGIIKPLLTKEFCEKLHVLPDDPEAREVALDALVEKQFRPDFRRR
ncbi:CRAL/TRIO domain containing protein [Fragilaria crotonensis]|nr:CRAL/TRIO domain containing protein [Fragilaria crotonensis]